MDRVVAKLAEVAKERRGKLPLHEIARKSTVGEDAIRKFERGNQGRNIDRMANAYAAALGDDVSVFDLWDEALRRARKAAGESGSSQREPNGDGGHRPTDLIPPEDKEPPEDAAGTG